MSRAKCLLIIVGDHRTLKLDENLAWIVDYCSNNNCLIEASPSDDVQFFTKKSSERSISCEWEILSEWHR